MPSLAPMVLMQTSMSICSTLGVARITVTGLSSDGYRWLIGGPDSVDLNIDAARWRIGPIAGSQTGFVASGKVQPGTEVVTCPSVSSVRSIKPSIRPMDMLVRLSGSVFF